MRVTQQMRIDGVLANLELSSEKLFNLQDEVSSGKKLSMPEDDPIGVGQDLLLRTDTAANDQYIQTLGQAKSWLDSTDGSLQDIVSSLQRIRELVVEGANTTLSNTDEQAIGTEIHQLLLHTVDTANTKVGDEYIFSGFATTTQPFTYNSGTGQVVYNPPTGNPPSAGNAGNGLIQLQIQPGENLAINVPGGAQQFTNLFATLTGLDSDFNSLTGQALTTSLSGQRLSQLDTAISSMTNLLADVGAKENRVTVTTDRLTQNSVGLAQQLSNVEDLDIPKAITDLQSQQTTYQAALATGAKVIQQTLLDFLK